MISSGSKICFITPPSPNKTVVRDYAGGLGFEADSGYILPPLDNLQMAACIDDTFEVSVIDAQAERLSLDDLVEKLAAQQVLLVVCEFSVPTLDDDIACAEQIAQAGIVVIGKVHSQESSILEKILSGQLVRLCLVAECEDILADILLGKILSGTAQWIDGQLSVVPKEFVANLDAMPFPLRSLTAANKYWYPKLGDCTTILSSRGCPYLCRYYCPYPMTQGRKWRFRSSESVLDELESIAAIGINRVLFRDPVFSLDAERVSAICTGILDRSLDLEWWCETRADLLPNELLDSMAEAGCKGINVGVESGDPNLRFSKLKRGVSDDVLLRVSNKTQEVGIQLSFLLMVGFPGENRASVLATATLIQQCRPSSIGIGFPVHHPGTQLEKDAIANDWIIHQDYQLTDGSLPVLAGPGLSPDAMVVGRDYLLKLFDAIESLDSEAEQQWMTTITDWSKGD